MIKLIRERSQFETQFHHYEVLGKLSHLSDPLFSHLYNEDPPGRGELLVSLRFLVPQGQQLSCPPRLPFKLAPLLLMGGIKQVHVRGCSHPPPYRCWVELSGIHGGWICAPTHAHLPTH